MHTDLCRLYGEPYNPKLITITLNRYFIKSSVPIRILKTYLVPSTFNCRRNVVSRTYLYRLCVVKSARLNAANYLNHLPIEELERCLFIW